MNTFSGGYADQLDKERTYHSPGVTMPDHKNRDQRDIPLADRRKDQRADAYPHVPPFLRRIASPPTRAPHPKPARRSENPSEALLDRRDRGYIFKCRLDDVCGKGDPYGDKSRQRRRCAGTWCDSRTVPPL
ncbi:hypothetical protein Pth03_72120 [Planotetraspora thailandica]|uniref:Uncharacterized protein n=1 Tax=Planotetraspora thailandica TaxID=487172 RepID=A0A8J3Y0X5_9ACTN|nr:hypothetical protein Pth03_72120 [Planotetraspora thailandica]